MLVRMSFTITMAIFGAVLICFFMLGCSAAAPLYVIDVQKLAGVEPTAADQLLQEMVPCQLKWEHRWEEEHWLKGEADVLHIGKLYDRMYEIENGQMIGGNTSRRSTYPSMRTTRRSVSMGLRYISSNMSIPSTGSAG